MPGEPLIPRLGPEAEYLESRRIADQLRHADEALGGLSKADALKMAVICAAFGATFEPDPDGYIPPPATPKPETQQQHDDNDFTKQRAALKTLATSLRSPTVGVGSLANPDSAARALGN